jgi:hypothetical protein
MVRTQNPEPGGHDTRARRCFAGCDLAGSGSQSGHFHALASSCALKIDAMGESFLPLG